MGSKKGGFKSTLSLISIIEYSKTYQALKEKHKDMVKVTLGKTFVTPLFRWVTVTRQQVRRVRSFLP